jgi:hypothetical protein
MSKSNQQNDDDVLLTTIDNPFDPFTQWQLWYNYDEQSGYHTCSYLDRMARTGTSQSDYERQQSIRYAMEEIVKYNPMYTIVEKGKRFDKETE